MGKGTYAGLFVVTLATLMYEILLTRIFSVTMWYHYAFMAISIAMFGMTVGALAVYLWPGFFREERTRFHMAWSALLFSVTMVFSLMILLCFPLVTGPSVLALFSMGLNYAAISIPFAFSGLCVCLALTRFPGRVGPLYAADLAGAAVGCVLLIYTLEITDGPTAVFVAAFFAAMGSFMFLIGGSLPRLRALALATAGAIGLFAVYNTGLASKQQSQLRLMWLKGHLEQPLLYEKWNSFSRITVHRAEGSEKPFGGGLSSRRPVERNVDQLMLLFDGCAASVLTRFSGDIQSLDYMKYDVTNLAHYLRAGADVLVIGVGGGRDILSALAFGQKSVTGVEINQAAVDVVNGRFGEYTGYLNERPGVRFVVDEARSWLARQDRKFDIIQISLTDTWAATAAGAFALAENSLYTVEAWTIFLNKLAPEGVLSVTRWHSEIRRLTALAAAGLKAAGVDDPRRHIMIVASPPPEAKGAATEAVATLLVSPTPFSPADVDTLRSLCDRMGFELALWPQGATDETLAALATGQNPEQVAADSPLNLTAPTDDSPFFFNMLRLRDVFKRDLRNGASFMSVPSVKAVRILATLLIVVVGLTALCIVAPLWLKAPGPFGAGNMPLLAFFVCIGLGFMLIEMSMMQRLMIFLGHPTYALSVVLFTLLLSSGLGSYLTHWVGSGGWRGAGGVWLVLLLGALTGLGLGSPVAVRAFAASETWRRIAVSAAILAPAGVLMGMPFPLGMKRASQRSAALTPWLWGLNGAASVCASVLSVAIALGSGISAAFWTGLGCYAAGAVAFAWAGRGTKAASNHGETHGIRSE